MDLKVLIQEYLKEARLIQIATAKENQPWVCTVYFAYDDSLSLYWISTPERRHSQEIADNEKVAGAIVLPYTPGDKVRGLQFQGTAKVLTTSKEQHDGMDAYASRMGMNQDRKKKILEGKDNHRSYKITPTLFVLFDEVNFPDSPRQEYRL